MLSFSIDKERCFQCGECVTDCPAQIIGMAGEFPAIAQEAESRCYRCQHCFAVCPSGAISILGLLPEQSLLVAENLPSAEQLETLMKGRRSVRRYQEENVSAGLVEKLLEVAWHAPTGVNSRQVRFTVIAEREKMAALREQVMAGIAGLVRSNSLPERYARFAAISAAWEEKGVDIIFRDAPHIVIASAPQDVPTPLPDCLIALSYFELFARANGLGAVWGGLAKCAIDDLVPETRRTLGIPEEHLIGYVVIFGIPAVHYPRTVQHAPALIHLV